MKDPIFQNFVCDLWISTTAAGGELTLEKTTPPRGTMTKALKMLSPHLPDRFVPKALAGSTLQNIRNFYSRIIKAEEEFERGLSDEIS